MYIQVAPRGSTSGHAMCKISVSDIQVVPVWNVLQTSSLRIVGCNCSIMDARTCLRQLVQSFLVWKCLKGVFVALLVILSFHLVCLLCLPLALTFIPSSCHLSHVFSGVWWLCSVAGHGIGNAPSGMPSSCLVH